jgi:hypothetical protein
MLEKTQARALPLLNKTVDLTPAVSACCGACRTCMTTNVLTLAGAGVVGLAVYARRLTGRVLRRS